jgi:hypothetical protein
MMSRQELSEMQQSTDDVNQRQHILAKELANGAE